MVLVHTSLILHPRAENFLSSVRIAGGKFSNRADCGGFYCFDVFQTMLASYFSSSENQLKLQMNTSRLATY